MTRHRKIFWLAVAALATLLLYFAIVFVDAVQKSS
jgi:hypothetical protein